MSAKQMGMVWDLVLTPPKQIVLLALADHADHVGGSVHPGVPLIAWKTGYSERQVQRVMKQLENDGLLIKVAERRGRPTLYRIDVSAGTLKEPYQRKTLMSATPDNMTGDKMSGVTSHEKQNVLGGDIALANLSSIRQSTEPSKRTSSHGDDGGALGSKLDGARYSKAFLDELYEAIALVWDTRASGRIVSMRAMMLGIAKRGEWKDCNFVPAVSGAQEVLDFGGWAKRAKVDFPQKSGTTAITVQSWFYEWREHIKKRAAVGAKSVAPIELPELNAADYRRVDASGNWIGSEGEDENAD